MTRWPFGKILLIAAILSAIAIAVATKAGAQQQSLRDWFNKLKSPAGELCCFDFDGIGLDDLQWKSEGGKYWVFVKGQWVVIPDNAVVSEPNRAKRAIVWLRSDGSVRCFLPGPLS